VTELIGLLLLVAGLGGSILAAGLVAACLRIGSPIEFVLATYVLAWSWIVAVTLALSPPHLVTRGWLLAGIGVGLVLSLVLWVACGQPRPPRVGSAIAGAREALRRPALLVLAIAVAVGGLYSAALSLFVPANEGDALSYQLARAAFWKQEAALGYVAGAVEPRLDVNPPNAEIGQLATILLSGGDRFVTLPQLGAYVVLVLCAVALARRIGLTREEALFGGLAFATLPIIALQASAALNDLVVASFLAVIAVFALRAGRRALLLVALSLGLAVGTKFTAVLALPTLMLVMAVGRPPRHWLGLGLAGIGGLALGSVWYAVNLAQTGKLDGGLADSADQRIEPSLSAVIPNAMQLGLDLFDMSGAVEPHSAMFVVAAVVLATLALVSVPRSIRDAMAFFAAALVTGGVLLTAQIERLGQDTLDRAWATFGKPDQQRFEGSLGLNLSADPIASWFGPLGLLLLVAGPAVITVLWLRRRTSGVSLALAAAPWTFLLTLAATIAWDPFRGRFLVFGVALAAASWGILFRLPVVAPATAAIGTTALALSLANYQGKPSGLGDVWPREQIRFVSLQTIWGASRPDAQARLRPEEGEEDVYRYLEDNIRADASVAVAARGNDFLSPYFGPRFSRDVWLASRTKDVHESAEWLVLAPGADARRCRAAWRRELAHGSGWRIERRIGPDTCAG